MKKHLEQALRRKRLMEPETIEKNGARQKSTRVERNFFSKMFCLLISMGFASTMAFANPVNLQKAKQVGQSFLQAKPAIRQSNKALQFNLVKTEKAIISKIKSNSSGLRSSASDETPVFYVFNNEGGGFIIVSGDDCVKPVLGYSETGSFDPNNIPPNATAWLEGYKEQISYAIENDVASTKEIQSEWNALETGARQNAPASTQAVAPLIQTQWNQNSPYNNKCPADVNASSGHVYTGCVATAMAQVMKYWNYPTIGTGSHSYNNAKYGTLSANFGNTIYDWNNMPNQLTSLSSSVEINAVATLMFHCGVSVDTDYKVNGSGAFAQDITIALPTYFDYKSTLLKRMDYSNPTQWINLLKAEINAARPALYSGIDTTYGSYEFVCDGYDDNNNFHFNWGWSGSGDGYFTVDNLNPASYHFNASQIVIIGIEPANGSPETTWYIGNPIPTDVAATFTYNSGTLTISGIGAVQSDYVIAPWYSEKDNIKTIIINSGVTNISDNAFKYCSGLTSVTIPNSVTSIGRSAFLFCSALTSVTIPNSVTSIGNSTFNACSSLTSVTIPNSVTSIGDDAFSACSSLTSVTIPNSVTSIGRSAFMYCNLKSLSIPNSITSIGASAFEGNTGITTLTIPSSVTYIDMYAFADCSGLTSLNYNATNNIVTNIYYPIFQGCTNLSILNIGSNVRKIPAKTFSNCTGLTSLIIPNSIDSIGYGAFSGCTNLQSVTIKDGTQPLTFLNWMEFSGDTFSGCSIGSLYFGRQISYYNTNSPFSGNTLLTSLEIGSNVTSIGDYCFAGCTELSQINSYALKPPTTGIYAFNNVNKSIDVKVPCGCLNAYKANSFWNTFTKINDGGCTGIEAIATENLQIFPNPVKSELFIKSDLLVKKIEICDISGRVVETQHATSLQNGLQKISVSALSQGIYIVKIYTENGWVIRKVMKE